MSSGINQKINQEQALLFLDFKANAGKYIESMRNLNTACTFQESNPSYIKNQREKIEQFVQKMGDINTIFQTAGKQFLEGTCKVTQKSGLFCNKKVRVVSLEEANREIQEALNSRQVQDTLRQVGILPPEKEEVAPQEGVSNVPIESKSSWKKTAITAAAILALLAAGFAYRDKLENLASTFQSEVGNMASSLKGGLEGLVAKGSQYFSSFTQTTGREPPYTPNNTYQEALNNTQKEVPIYNDTNSTSNSTG